MDKMSKREFLNAVIAGEMTEAVAEFAKGELVAMDKANAKRREKQAEKAQEGMADVKALAAKLGAEAMTASDLMVALAGEIKRADGKEMNVQFVSSLARKAVKAGMAAQVDVKVKGKGIQKGYIAVA